MERFTLGNGPYEVPTGPQNPPNFGHRDEGIVQMLENSEGEHDVEGRRPKGQSVGICPDVSGFVGDVEADITKPQTLDDPSLVAGAAAEVEQVATPGSHLRHRREELTGVPNTTKLR